MLVTGAQAIVLEWDANSETNIAGYRVFVGPTSRGYVTNYTTTNTFHQIANTNLFIGINFFAVTAFDMDGLESEYSDEVFWVNSTNRPGAVKGLRVRKLLVQSAPSVMGPWGQDVEIAQIETASGTAFYRLRMGDLVYGPPKRFLSTTPTKGAKVMPSRAIGPPPMPPK